MAAATFAGDSGYTTTNGTAALTVSRADQTITFGALSTKIFGDSDFAINATASSNLAVTFSASGRCSVTGSTVHLGGAGSCTVTASQAGDSNYNPAPAIPQSVTIDKALPQVTLFCSPASFDIHTHGCTAAATGIGNLMVSGGTTVSYNGNLAPPANAGTYSVSAGFISGDGNYTDATGSGSLVIAKATPTVTVLCPLGLVFDGNPKTCTAAAAGVGNTAVSGSLALTYGGGPAPSAGGTYTVSGSFVSGDSNYSDSTGISALTIAKAAQTITFAVLVTRAFGSPDFAVSATASSSLTVDFSASGTCIVTGLTVHLTGVGSCSVTAVQAGNADYSPATSIPRSFAISPGDDFTIASTLPSVIVTAGQPATDHITITPNPATLTALRFTCSGLPAKASCTFTPNPVPPGSGPTDVVMTITTAASATSALQRPQRLYTDWLGFTSMGLIGLVVVGVHRKSRKRALILGACSLTVLLMAIGCGARQQTPGIPSDTSTVTVTASTTSFTHSTTFTLTVN